MYPLPHPAGMRFFFPRRRMPPNDGTLSRETDGTLNEDYCKWCYDGGTFTYESIEQLIDFCVSHMASEAWPTEQVRAHMEAVVPHFKHWK